MNPTLPTTLLQQTAAAAAGHQSHPGGTLYVVATPIGNLADISLRAIHVLGLVDAVACEDTRVAGQLLQHLGWRKPLLAVHAHNEHAASEAVLRRLAAGERVAFISDAGTPAVSDPGAVLVAAVARAGHRVVPLPGPSSAVTAISVAGDIRGAGFAVVGFLPAKGSERQAALEQVLAAGGTQVLFEAPHRIGQLLQALATLAPQRSVTLCRELSKQFEDVLTRPAAELPVWLAADSNRLRGEFVLVLHALPASAAAVDALPAAAEHCLRVLLRELPLKQAVALAAEISAAPRKLLYTRALQWRDAGDENAQGPADDEGDEGSQSRPASDGSPL